MLNRTDVYTVPGGDTEQMVQTARGLRGLGLDICLATVAEAPPLSGFDLIHIFNWEQLEAILAAPECRISDGPPIVLSPIFWFQTGHWYDAAVYSRRLWRQVHGRLGAAFGRRLYDGWQRVKLRCGKRGKRLRECFSIPLQLLPNSRAELDYVVSTLGLKEDVRRRCAVVPNGIVRKLYDPPPRPNDSFVKKYGLKDFVLQVGRIQSVKNQLSLIQALYDIPVPIVFGGTPSPYEPHYVNRCYSLANRRGNVYFLGPQPREALAGIYPLAAVHVLPSWRETPGLVSLEAAAAGCRVVSTSVGGAREYLGDDAWYCNPWDVGSIRAAVLQALNSGPSERLRKRILERYTWDIAAEVTLQAYRRAVG